MPPLRFIPFVVVSLVAIPVATTFVGWPHGALIGFDVGALAFQLSLIPLARECDTDQMRRRAAANDASPGVLLAVTAAITLVILVAVALELHQKGSPPSAAIALIISTLVLSWLFMNSIFAVHYAHMYYSITPPSTEDNGGILFPNTPNPDYWDFIYFSYCLGMTFQTSDSNVTSGRFRRIMTFHCLLAFVFSIGVIAFTINVLGGGGGK